MENKLVYGAPASCFEEALPLGNGSLGAMVYGGITNERISLNHDTLWSGKPRHYTRPEAVETYLKAQKLVLEDKVNEAEQLLEQEFSADFGQSYMPLGNLCFECLGSGDATDYIRDLDIARGVATVSYKRGEVLFLREYFVSHPDNCAVVHLTSGEPSDYFFSADSRLKSELREKDGRLILTGEAPSFASPEYAREISPLVYNGEGIKFAAIGSIITDGKSESTLGGIKISGAKEITFILTVETSFIDFDTLPTKQYLEPCLEHAMEIEEKSYSLLLANHLADHSALYDRVKIDLGFAPSSKMTDERIRSENKDNDLGLVELLYNFGRYLVIAASREGSQATNLQGIWNEEVYPAWSSNYTVNINTEMNYWPVLMNNLAGLDMPVIELLKKISITGVDTARSFYGAGGYCCHHNIDLWGLSTPVGAQRHGCVRWSFWNMSAGWLCRHAWEHYEYTLDADFLRNTAYPLMKGAAEFYLDIMIKNGEHYTISPSTSPENSYIHNDGYEATVSRYTAMSQAILTDLFSNVLKAAKILGINDDFIENVESKLPYLCTYEIGSEGQLLEYDKEYTEKDIHHRHVSHLYGLYPGESITTEATPNLAEACRKTLLRRGDVSTGWSMGWRACLWSKLKDGDHSLILIKNQLKFAAPKKDAPWVGGSYANLFDAHPPFQIDGNYGVCAAVTLMLLQCEDEKIRILPALPEQFKKGFVKGLKAKGDITVDISWDNNMLVSCTLTSPTAQRVIVATSLGEVEVDLPANAEVKLK